MQFCQVAVSDDGGAVAIKNYKEVVESESLVSCAG